MTEPNGRLSSVRSLPKAVFDLLVAMLLVSAVYLTASLYDWNAQWIHWSGALKIYGLAQLPLALAAAAFALAWYAWRRMQESSAANRRWAAAVKELKKEMVQREQAEDAERRARLSLEKNIHAQRQRIKRIGLVREMGEYILSADSKSELLELSARYMGNIMPFESGVIYLRRPDGKSLKPVRAWGKASREPERGFQVRDCWALRRNKVFEEKMDPESRLCNHLNQDCRAGVVCVPVGCRTHLYGVVHFRYGDGYGGDDWLERRSQERNEIRELGAAVGDSIGLHFNNLGLRERLARESSRDPLTGLLNRRGLSKAVKRELHRASSPDFRLTLLMLDVDHFKRFNDTYGHDAGDLVLTTLADLIYGEIRARDILCRYGGEEFLVVMPATGPEAVRERVEQLRRKIAERPLEKEGQSLGQVTVSIGLASWPDNAREWDGLIRCADSALYQAKHQGRNRVVRAPPLKS
jgi:diguanylate cyclase (GGDEF)-like protein